MDKHEKRVIFASIGLMAFFFLAVILAVSGLGITVPDCITDREPFTEPEVIQLDETHYEVHSIARMWTFDPPVIEIPAGATLDIFLTSADVVHGFQIESRAVNMMAVPGQVTKMSAKFDKVGKYSIVCHEYCGVNHHSMEGVIHVRPVEDMPAREVSKAGSPASNATEGGAKL
ncbi:MAG: cytochrome c oxidase subunit II [Chlorobi bacterium]|nr:cytochrome c oxidase subunit II [Chlorobiota bacterium]